MKKKIVFLFLVAIFLTGCNTVPKPDVIQRDVSRPDVSGECEEAGGTWLAEYNECEYAGREWCEDKGGEWKECESACRHDPEAEICTMQCVMVCELPNGQTAINNFEDCVSAGHPVMESYPRQCAVPGGDSFTEVIEEDDEPDMLIGGQTDEHGCLGPAGYSWCEEKQKCLREWEEPCEPDPDSLPPKRSYSLIEEALVKKRGVKNFTLGIRKLTLSHFRGRAAEEPDGLVLAAKRNNDWVIVFDGEGGYSCEIVEPYNFPEDMISDCHSE